MALAHAPCLSGALGKQDLMPLVGKNFRKKFPNADFVVNDQNLCHRL